MMKINIMKNENIFIYAKENFGLMKMKKINLKYNGKLQITVIIQVEEQLIVYAI